MQESGQTLDEDKLVLDLIDIDGFIAFIITAQILLTVTWNLTLRIPSEGHDHWRIRMISIQDFLDHAP